MKGCDILEIFDFFCYNEDMSTNQKKELEVESKIFLTNLDEWRAKHLGEFVLIKDESVVGFFSSLDIAFEKGLELYSTKPFFVKRILPKDVVNVSFLGRSFSQRP